MESALMTWATVATAVFAGGSAWAAAHAIRVAIKSRNNERLLAYATMTLERAYLALKDPSHETPFPRADRLAWLTAARLIEEYKSAKARIEDPIILRECESHEEHWRRSFFLMLEPLALGHAAFYSAGSISETSAIIIHAFSEWPEGQADPLDAYPSVAVAMDKLGVSMRWFSLRTFLGLLR